MINYNNFKPDCSVDSTLCVKASGSINDDVFNDLIQTEGKSIAELIHDQKNPQTQNNENDPEKDHN
jgi:hypothetical protein